MFRHTLSDARYVLTALPTIAFKACGELDAHELMKSGSKRRSEP
jgi:hypothetical protein